MLNFRNLKIVDAVHVQKLQYAICKGGKSNDYGDQEMLYHCNTLHGYTTYYWSTWECDKETG